MSCLNFIGFIDFAKNNIWFIPIAILKKTIFQIIEY